MDKMSEEHILYGIEGNVALITLNRPNAKNAFSPKMILLWREYLERAKADDTIRVIVVTGRGTPFAPVVISVRWQRASSGPGI